MTQLIITDRIHRKMIVGHVSPRLISMRSLTKREVAIARELGIRRYYSPSLTEAESAELFREFDRFWDQLIEHLSLDNSFWRNVVSSKMQEWEKSASYLALTLFSLAKRSEQNRLSVVIVCSSVQEEDVCIRWGKTRGWNVHRRLCISLPYWIRRVTQEIRNAVRWFFIFKICLYKKSRSPEYEAKEFSAERNILITSLFYPNSFRDRAYVDPFFGNLHEEIVREGYFVNYLCESLGSYRGLARKIRTCERVRILLPYSLITWPEMVVLALRVLGRKVDVCRSRFIDCDLSDLIRWNARRFEHSFNFGAEVFYAATRKLCQKEKFTRLIQLYEGNVFERGCIQAFRKYGKSSIVGYSQAVVFAQNLKIRVTDKERERRPEPSFLICTGPENARLMIRLGNRIPTEVKPGCSLRYVPVADGRAVQSTTKSNILVALDGVWSSVGILDWLLEHAEVFADYQVTIRAHPNVPLNRLLEQCLNGKLPANYHESQDTLKEDIGKSFCTIYRQSSVGLQAILNGVPVIHLNVDAPLESDPINGLKALKWTARTQGELVRALREIRELDPAQRSQQVNEAQEYARRYFASPNDENIMPFYTDKRRADICNRSEDSFSLIDVESQEVSFGHRPRETQDQGDPIESDE